MEQKRKLMTLCCVYNETQVLLGEIKKEGVLKGMYNSFGGKVEPGEAVDVAAKRELIEEAGIVPVDFEKRGEIEFLFDEQGNPFEGKPVVQVHIYATKHFEGQPMESDEMRPEWFLHSDVPYDNMWPDDRYWLPLIFAEKKFRGTFHLHDAHRIYKHTLEEVEYL